MCCGLLDLTVNVTGYIDFPDVTVLHIVCGTIWYYITCYIDPSNVAKHSCRGGDMKGSLRVNDFVLLSLSNNLMLHNL